MTHPGSLATRATPAGGVQLYDEQRERLYTRPVLRGWSHLIWLAGWLVAGPVTIAFEPGSTRRVALSIYLLTLVGLFGTSAAYHLGRWSPTAMARLQRLDHVMIFCLIAGTATPEFLLALPGPLGRAAVIAMWTVTLTLAGLHLRWMHPPERLLGAAFLILGWGAGLALPAVWIRFGLVPVVLIALGGICYTVGAVCYHVRRPDPVPSIFGYHEVFHAFVCIAATCQFIAIVAFIA